MDKLSADYKNAIESSMEKEDLFKKKVLQVKKDNKLLEENVARLVADIKDLKK